VECHRGPFVRVVSGQEDGAAIDGEAAAVAGSLDLPVSDLVDPAFLVGAAGSHGLLSHQKAHLYDVDSWMCPLGAPRGRTAAAVGGGHRTAARSATRWRGGPRNAEPAEAGELVRADPNPLPSNTVSHPAADVRARLGGIRFVPHGWWNRQAPAARTRVS
jgi:hypothetical protein